MSVGFRSTPRAERAHFLPSKMRSWKNVPHARARERADPASRAARATLHRRRAPTPVTGQKETRSPPYGPRTCRTFALQKITFMQEAINLPQLRSNGI